MFTLPLFLLVSIFFVPLEMTPPGKKYFSKIIIALSFHIKIQSALQLDFSLVPIIKFVQNEELQPIY
jgi:hypothetical protein